ncbi:MAG: prolipoprotein diacylglyceryl transferase [Planctomycetia bacterium]|nr:prolipoprotein diacylglyceryl transferase [Planctomycetia bacterium]
MHQTLFYIPYEIGGIPLFGLGILFFVWLAALLLMVVATIKKEKGKWTSENSATLLTLALCGGVVCWGLPCLGREGGIAIQSYGTMMLLAIVTSVGLAAWRSRQFGFTPGDILDISLWLCIPGIIGARAFYVVEYWDEFQTESFVQTLAGILNFTRGGLVVYGSLFGGLLGGLCFLRTKKLPILRMFDLLAPSMALGLAIGRIGCFLNGCCFGGICDPAHTECGVCFPAGSPPFEQQLKDGKIQLDPDDFFYGMRLEGSLFDPTRVAEVEKDGFAQKHGLREGDRIVQLGDQERPSQSDIIEALIYKTRVEGRIDLIIERENQSIPISWTTTASPGPTSLPVYPTQLYSSANAFVLCIILLLYSYFRRAPLGMGVRRDGEVFVLFLALYAVGRFIIEMVRIDETGVWGSALSISQWVSLFVFLVAIALECVLLLRKDRSDLDSV